MSPLQLDDGTYIWINRGFVPMNVPVSANPTAAADAPVYLTGLIRMTEPKGLLLQRNDPAHDRWYSRDIRGLTLRRQLNATQTAPYFIDADASSEARPNDGEPVAGLTVISFRNPHLGYALTWFALALLPLLFILFTMRPALPFFSARQPIQPPDPHV